MPGNRYTTYLGGYGTGLSWRKSRKGLKARVPSSRLCVSYERQFVKIVMKRNDQVDDEFGT